VARSKKRENPPNLNASLHSYARPSPRCLHGPAGLLVCFFPLLLHEAPLSAHTSPPLQTLSGHLTLCSHSSALLLYIKKKTHSLFSHNLFITFYSLLLHPLTIFSSVIAKQMQTRSLCFSHSKTQTHYELRSNTQQRLSRNALLTSQTDRNLGTELKSSDPEFWHNKNEIRALLNAFVGLLLLLIMFTVFFDPERTVSLFL
jgi:hypothetical protein